MLQDHITHGQMDMLNLNIKVAMELGIVMELGMVMEVKVGDKGMVMVRNMELEIREDKERPIDHLVLKAKPITQPVELEELVSIHHPGALAVAREAMVEMGVIRVMVTKRKYRNTKYDFEDVDEEESDTEDSFELEITPQQLSQITPGGGVLKLTLSKKKPLQITAGAPSGEPVPSQTTVKTVYDPREEKRDQPVRGTTNIVQSGS